MVPFGLLSERKSASRDEKGHDVHEIDVRRQGWDISEFALNGMILSSHGRIAVAHRRCGHAPSGCASLDVARRVFGLVVHTINAWTGCEVGRGASTRTMQPGSPQI